MLWESFRHEHTVSREGPLSVVAPLRAGRCLALRSPRGRSGPSGHLCDRSGEQTGVYEVGAKAELGHVS